MAPKAKAMKTAVVETVAFANPTIRIPAHGKEGDIDYRPERIIKSQRGWQLTQSEKYPMTPFDKMLVDEAVKNGGTVKLNMEVSINLNQKSDKPLDTEGLSDLFIQ